MATVEPVEWQTTCTNFKERGALLLETEEWTDCKVLVGPEATPFRAHKLMLAMASPVFESMFYTDSAQEEDTFNLPDVEPKVFEDLLNFMYTEHIDITSYKSAHSLYIAANRFLIPSLVKVCADYMYSHVSMENACLMFEAGYKCQDQTLMNESLKIIKEHIKEILHHSSFEEADIDTVAAIFAIPELAVEEIELYEALERYARAHSNRKRSASPALNESGEETNTRRLVRKALKNIRFLTFSLEQFAKGPAQSGLLTPGEALALLTTIAEGSAPIPPGFSNSRKQRYLNPESPLLVFTSSSGTLQVELHSQSPWRSASSPRVLIGGRPWLLTALPHLTTSTSVHTCSNYLALFLKCEDASKGWASVVRVQFTLLARGGPHQNKTTSIQNTFSSEHNEWGENMFILWHQAVDTSRGFVADDGTLTIQAHVTILNTVYTPPTTE